MFCFFFFAEFIAFLDLKHFKILHKVQDIYAEESIMLQFNLPKNGLVVVGDLHGDLYCLLNILLRNGFPPKTKYLFLGLFSSQFLKILKFFANFNVSNSTKYSLILTFLFITACKPNRI